jgi:hypothetical protein
MPAMRPRGSWLAAALLAWALCIVGSGCSAHGPGRQDDRQAPGAELPGYEALFEAAERRNGTLDRLWATAVTSLRYTDAQGERRRDQGEGHFQLARPGSLALFIGKLGETYLVLGSDLERYWWLERLEERVAYVGQSSLALERSTAVLGVPLLPSDLVLAMDLARWPEPGGDEVRGVDWSGLEGVDPARTARVLLYQAGRSRAVHVDVFTLEPVAVEILTDRGEALAVSRLSGYETVRNLVGAPVAPRVPTRVQVELPSADARLELTLGQPEMSERRPKASAFDLEGLLRAFGIGRVVDLDERRVSAGAGR